MGVMADQQRRALGHGDSFAVKIENRSDSVTLATKWLNASADQVGRIFDILSEDQPHPGSMPDVPPDFPVKVLGPNDPAEDLKTCGTCERSWDDAVPTEWTPAPAARCPFEYFH